MQTGSWRENYRRESHLTEWKKKWRLKTFLNFLHLKFSDIIPSSIVVYILIRRRERASINNQKRKKLVVEMMLLKLCWCLLFYIFIPFIRFSFSFRVWVHLNESCCEPNLIEGVEKKKTYSRPKKNIHFCCCFFLTLPLMPFIDYFQNQKCCLAPLFIFSSIFSLQKIEFIRE